MSAMNRASLIALEIVRWCLLHNRLRLDEPMRNSDVTNFRKNAVFL